jgi:5'-3' exonuclease
MSKSFDNIKGCSDSTLMIVDGLNLAFRYMHAKSSSFVDDYIRVVDSLRNSYKANKVIIACDKGSSAYRKELFPDYKIGRKAKYENQTDEEREQVEAFFKEFESTLLQISTVYPVLRFDQTEADDIAGYITTKIKNYPSIKEIWLISSDKDWDLLIDENTSRFSYVTRKEVTFENWNTHYDCSIEEYISIKCLTGDSGDSIPGVPGIGPKRAAELVREYGSALDIVCNLPIQSKYKHIQSLNNSKDIIMRNYALMDLVTFSEEALKHNTKEIDKILKEYLK